MSIETLTTEVFQDICAASYSQGYNQAKTDAINLILDKGSIYFSNELRQLIASIAKLPNTNVEKEESPNSITPIDVDASDLDTMDGSLMR